MTPARARRGASAALVRAGLALLLALCGAVPLHADAAPINAERLDRILRLGEDWSDDSAAAWAALDAPRDDDERHALALTRAQIAASSGALAAARLPVADADPALTEADRLLIAALRAERASASDAEALARRALGAYEAACNAHPGAPPDCAYRPRWRAQLVLLRAAGWQRSPGLKQVAEAALDLARAGNDGWRQVATDYELALFAITGNDLLRASRHVEQARRVALAGDDPAVRARVFIVEALLRDRQGDAAAAQRSLQQGLALARQARLPRLEALALVNLSDIAVRSGRAAEALQAAEQALPIVRRHDDWRIERALWHNAALARVALGRAAEAGADFERLQRVLETAGDTGFQVASMREYGDALGAIGDFKSALETHHRERELTRRLSDTNRDRALAELRTRFDRETQQRRLGLLERDSALASAALENHALTQRLWALGLGALALAATLMVLLLRRVRATNQRLVRSQAHLRVQSERDALTGLANRRHFQAAISGGGAAHFSGALLMIDIDHFKQVNDGHGHAAGDAVLVEAARRITAALRTQDLVARWGGEEFLAWSPGLEPAELAELAQRVLGAIADTAFTMPDGRALRVTVSIGHAVFPLPPHRAPLTLEKAIALVDKALYSAKHLGRNRAVGIVAADLASTAALAELAAGREDAAADGRLQLRIDLGPQAPEALSKAAPEAHA